MAEEQSTNFSATFPLPPPFYKHFTKDNLAKLKAIQEKQDDDQTVVPSVETKPALDAHQLLGLPEELRYLVPPKPPASGKYRSFGANFDIHETLPSLEDVGVLQLYPSPDPTSTDPGGIGADWTLDRAFYLQKMAKSILLQFLEYVGTLAVEPTEFPRVIENMKTLFNNMHHLINEYRPHQARETLIMMMEDQLEQKRAEVEGIRKLKEKMEAMLEDLGREQPEDADGVGEDDGDVAARRDQENLEHLWQGIEEEVAG